MATRKVGTVGGASIVRLTTELREIGLFVGDNVSVVIKGDEIIIKKEVRK